MLALEDQKCPLIFASYIGDSDTVESLLFSGAWTQESLDRGLMYATSCCWVDCMLNYFIDGRADSNYKLSIGAQHAALLGRTEAVMLSLSNGCEVENLRSQYVWLAHMDRSEVVSLVLERDPGFFLRDHIFMAAVRGRAESTIRLMLQYPWKVTSPEVVNLVLGFRKFHHFLPALVLEKDAPVDGDALKNRTLVESGKIRDILRAQNVARRWRQVRAIVRIWHFWREWLIDYYCPGNQCCPQGKGFLRARDRFLESS